MLPVEKPDTLRRTKIVCTLGPASQSEEKIEALVRAGMNVARINFSHGTRAEHAATMEIVRAVAARLGEPVAILQDLQGPKIRTGPLISGQPVELRTGQRFVLTTEAVSGTAERVSTTYELLPRDVKPGDQILLSDGEIQLRVEESGDTEVICQVVNGGLLAEHQGINLPGVAVSAPALTEKDRADLIFGIEQRVDYVALSFVRRASDIAEAKDLIKDLTAKAATPSLDGSASRLIPVIAKLEKPEAIERLESILQVADGIMVARGDLGVEMPLEDVPLVQKRVIAQANSVGLPVITATQMLESMIHNPRPTRAEASDVANAILDGTDAVMLSGETAVGQYPVEAVQVMARIALATEGHFSPASRPEIPQPRPGPARAVSAAAHTLADHAGGGLIAVFTQSGMSAQLISKERPQATIVAYTPFESVYQKLALWWGVTPRLSHMAGTTEELIAWVDSQLQQEGLASPGTLVVIMGGMPIVSRSRTNFIKLHEIGES